MSRIPQISFVTCVSDWQTYEKSVDASLKTLDTPKAMFEQIPIENTGNQFSASQALNQGIQRSLGRLVVLCHQDLLFPRNWLSCLLQRIDEVESQAPAWGVIGLAGCCREGSRAGHVMDPHGEFYYPPLPREVQTLDELCLIIRRDSGLRFDEHFDHFHLYGADLCLTAITRGLACFAIDCRLEHISGGYKGNTWYAQKEKLMRKWWPKRHIVGKRIYTTSGTIRLHSPLVRFMRRFKNHIEP